MIAVGHSMLVIIYHMLQQQKSYEELGGNYFDERERQATEKRLVRRLEKLGYQVVLESAPQVALGADLVTTFSEKNPLPPSTL